ncbi:MAG: hypothetical protein AAF530_04780 [Pseudomonadota bacterium]
MNPATQAAVTAQKEASDHQAALGQLAFSIDRLKAANVNPDSFLATDYLNHFNEIIMLMELIPSMPDCLEDARAWQPKTYQEHFQDSGLADAELIIQAYEKAPEAYRRPFDAAVTELNNRIAYGLTILEGKLAADKVESLDAWGDTIMSKLNRSVESLSAMINGSLPSNDQGEVDSIIDA